MRWIEGNDNIRDPIDLRWRQLPSADRLFVTSRIARLECRCKPLRDKQNDLLLLYDIFFASKEVAIREIDAAVVEKATDLRATVGLKPADAIHAASAILAGVIEFWTTDAQLTKCPGLTVVLFKAV